MNKAIVKATITILVFLLCVPMKLSGQVDGYKYIDDGLYIGKFTAPQKSIVDDSKILIIKIDPNLYSLRLLCADELGDSNLTVEEWAKKYHLIGAINAGMFKTDHKTNVGYMKNYGYVNNSKINPTFHSVAAFNAIDTAKSNPFQLFDIDPVNKINIENITNRYNTVIQNLRLIRHPSVNVWPQQKKMWSEAALGKDTDGNVLFIFVRSPYSMHDLNNILISLPIDIVCAQHLEGGPEASLYFRHNNIEIEVFGSYESSFNENDNNSSHWPIPNVIGFCRKK